MDWYLVVLITYFVICSITTVIALFNEEYALYWAVGLPCIIIYILLYPVRAWVHYERCKGYFNKYGISRLQYIFGKRVKD